MKTEIKEGDKKAEEELKEKYESGIFRIIRIMRHPIMEYRKWKEREKKEKLMEEENEK